MEIRVLGPMELTHDGTAIDAAGRPRDLLALLVATHPEGLTVDTAGDAIWPDKEAAAGRNNVRVNLHKLRKLLPDEHLVVREDDRYHLRIPPEHLDAHRFRAGIAEARATADAGDPRRACVEFETACAAWRGRPFDGFFGIGPIDAARERLEQLHLDALCDYAAALLADDRADEVVRALEPWIDDHLTNEALAGQLMLGLFHCARQSDALQLFARVSDALDDLHGVAPGSELRGIADVIVTKPLASTANAPRAPLHAVRNRRPVDFVGRTAELDALRESWARAVDGVPQLALVAGPGGMGKSVLAKRFIDAISDDTTTVIVGTCEPDPVDLFQPFPQLVRDALALAPATDTAPSLLGELHQLAPDLSDRLPESGGAPGPAAGRQRLFRAVASLLTATVGPRLIVLDDIHWAGADSVDLFRHVLRDARGQVMILLTYRPDELGTDHPFHRSREHGRLSRPDLEVTLRGMDRNELTALIDATAPAARRNEFHRSIAQLEEVSAGNPLRFREVLRQLELEPDTPIAEIVPDDFRSLIARRLDRVEPEVRRILGVGAVLGRVFSLEIAATIAAMSVDDALDHLDTAIAQGFLVEGDAVDDYAFAHPLVRNAVYYLQVKGRRARTHVRCAELLRDQRGTRGTPGWSEIGRHLFAAQPISDPRATSDAARRAGDEALARFAHGEAAEWYGAALECANATFPAAAVARMRLAYGIALDRCGRVDESQHELLAVTALADELGDRYLKRDAVIALTPIESVLDTGFGKVLSDLAYDTLELFAPDDPDRVLLLRSVCLARLYVDPDVARGLAEEADRIARSSTDRVVHYSAQTVRYIAAITVDDEDRLAISRDTLDYCQANRLVVEEGMARKRLLNELLIVGDIAEFDTEIERFAEHARATSSPAEEYWVAALAATRGLMVDPSAATEELIHGAARIGRRVQNPQWEGLELLQLFALRYEQGRVREVTPELRAPTPTAPPVVAGTALLALAHNETGNLDAARAVLDRAVDDREVLLPIDTFRMGALGLFAGVAAGCGTSAQRAVLRDELLARPDRFCVFGSAGAVFGTNRHWLARLAVADGDPDLAVRHLTRAAELCDNAGAGYWAERARRELIEIGEQAPIH